jgi:hypothetical protein
MSRRTQYYLLAALGVVLALTVYHSTRSASSPVTGVFAEDTKFAPLDVHEPQLRVDLLEKLRKLEYSGAHRNIFLAAPPPLPVSAPAEAARPFVGPQLPPPPPPLQVPAEFFGYATKPLQGGRHVAFLSSGDDVLVVAEGDTFLNRFRLVHVGNDSLDVEEISSGRHATLNMTLPDQPQSP